MAERLGSRQSDPLISASADIGLIVADWHVPSVPIRERLVACLARITRPGRDVATVLGDWRWSYFSRSLRRIHG
jgi:hypothetical protein